MLTDEQIEQYLYKYAKLQDELSSFVVRTIAERVNEIENLQSYDQLNTLEQVTKFNSDIRALNRAINGTRKKQKEQMYDDFWEIVIYMYAEAQRFYENGQVVLQANKEIVDLVDKILIIAQKSMDELTKNAVILLRDMKNPAKLKAYTVENAYKSIVQEAKQYKFSKTVDLPIAMKRTETQLFASGVRFTDKPSSSDPEHATSANRALRMNVLDSMKTLMNKVQDVMGAQFGANGYELSAHLCPAPDHAPAQGHQFTKEEVEKMQSGEDFKDVNGHTYAGFERNIGQWNCRHYFTKIKLGAEPQYSQKQLTKILEDNERGYTTPDGKHYTLYECAQIQRRYERNIRNAKEQYLFYKSLGDKNSMATVRNRIGALTLRYKQFSRACDLPAKMERLKVKDYK